MPKTVSRRRVILARHLAQFDPDGPSSDPWKPQTTDACILGYHGLCSTVAPNANTCACRCHR